jgi:hypothetical protein
MTADKSAGALSKGHVLWVAPGEYREGEACVVLPHRVSQGAFERLERSNGKLLRSVLRGRGASNGPLLPDNRNVT